MHIPSRRQLFGMAFWLGTLLLAGCSGQPGQNQATPSNGATPGPNAGLEPQNVTIGYLPNIVLPQPLIGMEEGEFTRRISGVAFKEKMFAAGPAVLEALRAGAVDIAYTGPYPPLKAFLKDKDVVLLGGCATGGTELSVARNSTIRSVRDLKGKVIAVNQSGSTVDALVKHLLIGAGLNPRTDVRIVPVDPAAQAEALQDGDVDAVAAPAPWPSYVTLKGKGRVLVNYRRMLDNGNYLQGVYFTTKRFIQENPNFVRRFVEVNREITDELNQDREKGNRRVLDAWSKASKKTLDPAVARAAFATIQFTNRADLKTLERDARIAVETGALRANGDLTGFLYNPNAP